MAESRNSTEDSGERNRERDLMMHFMLANLQLQRQERNEEEEMLQRAIEESKRDSGYPDPDEMTYEQLLELEEENGKVSKGLKPF